MFQSPRAPHRQHWVAAMGLLAFGAVAFGAFALWHGQ